MLVRIRWFLLGVVATLGGGMVALGRYARRRITLAAVGRVAARLAADALERAGDAIAGERA
jgi:hypothetical protein